MQKWKLAAEELAVDHVKDILAEELHSRLVCRSSLRRWFGSAAEQRRELEKEDLADLHRWKHAMKHTWKIWNDGVR